MKNKSYLLNSIQKDCHGKKGKVMAKKCYQCHQQSVIKYKDSYGDWTEQCLNNCGPEILSNLINYH